MKTKKLVIGTFAAAAVLALGSIGFATAQTADDPPGNGATQGTMPGRGPMGGGNGDTIRQHAMDGTGTPDTIRQRAMDGTGAAACLDTEQQTQMHEAAATELGITVEELNAQLAAGKTVADIATEKGIDFETVRDAMQAARPAGHGPGMMNGGRFGAN
jgi:hypothetical protein